MGSVGMSDQRYKQAEFAAWVGITGNLLLTIMKGAVGLSGNSKALIADAAHSASDVARSLADLIGLRAAKKPPRDDYPYRHGRAESIAAIIICVLLLVVGVEIAISAVKTIVHGVSAPPNSFAIIAIVISIVVKEVMFRYKYNLGKKLASKALIANAWEHRSDVYSSFMALAGVAGALIGNSLGVNQLYLLDPLASFFIALLLLRMGYKLVMEAIHNTFDQVMQAEDAAELVSTVQKIKGVITVDDLRAREHGHYVIVDVKISVNPKISVHEGHDIARNAKQQLMKRFIHVSDVFIHVNPYDPGYPYKNNVDSDQDESRSLLH
jgi:cation diffusion facilitator family transporter